MTDQLREAARLRGALETVAQWDAWARDWLDKNPPALDAAPPAVDVERLDVALIRRVTDGWYGSGASGDDWDDMMAMLREYARLGDTR
jgi:hypothetical protein